MTLLRRRHREVPPAEPLLAELAGALVDLRAATTKYVEVTDSVRDKAREMLEEAEIGDRRSD